MQMEVPPVHRTPCHLRADHDTRDSIPLLGKRLPFHMLDGQGQEDRPALALRRVKDLLDALSPLRSATRRAGGAEPWAIAEMHPLNPRSLSTTHQMHRLSLISGGSALANARC